MFKVILWATDGSSGAEQALPFAKGLAQAHGARLIVVHINEIALGRAAGPVIFNEDEVQAAIQKQVEDPSREVSTQRSNWRTWRREARRM